MARARTGAQTRRIHKNDCQELGYANIQKNCDSRSLEHHSVPRDVASTYSLCRKKCTRGFACCANGFFSCAAVRPFSSGTSAPHPRLSAPSPLAHSTAALMDKDLIFQPKDKRSLDQQPLQQRRILARSVTLPPQTIDHDVTDSLFSVRCSLELQTASHPIRSLTMISCPANLTLPASPQARIPSRISAPQSTRSRTRPSWMTAAGAPRGYLQMQRFCLRVWR